MNQVYKNWIYSKDSLRNYVNEIIVHNDEIQFYYPYRGRGLQSVLRVVYEDSLYLDFSGRILVPINDIGYRRLNNRMKKGDYKNRVEFFNEIVNRIGKLESMGIYSITKSDTTIRVTTCYYDCTYECIKESNPSYKEDYYESKHFEGSRGRKFVIAFLLTKRNLSPGSILTLKNGIHYLWMLDSSTYYYRTYIPRNL